MFFNQLFFYSQFNIKNYKQAIYIYSFYVSILVLFFMSGNANDAFSEGLIVRALWVAGLLSVLLASDLYFQAEEENGVLRYVTLWKIPTEWLVLAKFIAMQLVFMLPLSVVNWVAATLLGIEPQKATALAVLLGVAMMGASAITMLAAALAAGVGRKGALSGILVLPLIIPIIIFGAGASLAPEPFAHDGFVFVVGFAGCMIPICCTIAAAALRSK